MIPIGYNVRSLMVRRTTSAATIFGIALVVFVLASTLMLREGVEKTISANGKPDLALVLRKGSDNELSSVVGQDKVGTILSAPGVARGADGLPQGLGEVAMVIMLEPLAVPGGQSNVQIRGIPSDFQKVRRDVRIVEGRALNPGAAEAIVGRGIAGRFKNLSLGDTFEARKNRPLEVVGIFEDNGSAFESEVWADLDTVRSAFGREGMVSSVRVKLDSPSAFEAFEAAVESDRRLGLEAMSEDQWNAKQSQFLSIFVTALGGVVSVFFGMGAIIGAMITMYASIADRQREIGTLRAIGFPQWQILTSFLLESLLLALTGSALGCLAALGMGSVRFSMLNFATFSEMVFTFKPTPTVFLISLGFTVGLGILGGFLPALRAARMSPAQAMRG